MVILERAVKFEEVDAAGIVFFARFATYGHEAMENFFSQVEGGYVGLITKRRVGFPAVKFESEFLAPLRYGDDFSIETSVEKLGGRSAVFLYEVKRKRDDVLAARMRHTVVITDLNALCSCEMPADVRRALAAHVIENEKEKTAPIR